MLYERNCKISKIKENPLVNMILYIRILTFLFKRSYETSIIVINFVIYSYFIAILFTKQSKSMR